MTVHYSDGRVTVHHGECLDVLATLPDCSVDSIVTDPPYGLSNTDPAKVTAAIIRWVGGEREFVPDGRGFMGHQWDRFVPPPAVWDECMRVLKPGGHMLVFAGSRTQDLMGLSIRLSGFDLRDSVAWLYGSGFPKSLDVSKAIDKQRDDVADVRVVCRWLRDRIDAHPTESIRTIAAHFGFHTRMVDHWAARDTDSQPTLPTLEQWDTLRDLLGFDESMDAEVFRLNLRKGEPGEAWADRTVTGQFGPTPEKRATWAITSRDGLRRDIPATPDAERWQGWGTALKPGHEPIILARKPFPSTVAANVQEWGTGALNIDGCRIEATDKAPFPAGIVSETEAVYGSGAGMYANRARPEDGNPSGRWPANVALDETTAQELDQMSGTTQSRIGKPRGADSGEGWGMTATGAEYDDQGGASRFFFVASREGGSLPSCEPAKTAEPSSNLQSEHDGSVPNGAATSGSRGETQSSGSKEHSTNGTRNASKLSGEIGTRTIPSIERECSPESPQPSSIPSGNRASDAEIRGQTGTTTTTPNLSKSGGSAVSAISPITSTLREAGEAGLPVDDLDARFMFTAKADSNERPRIDGVAHSTVKPLDLVRWLVRLITPPGGKVLDPFGGSGTTGEAAILERFRAIVIERDADYLPLITQRVHRRLNPVEAIRQAGGDLGLFDDDWAIDQGIT